ncbi:MAG: phytanoyl-CoA dioxygenase family protein [Caldilineaceae bacterium]|nr:phytanoyl-CoA dioxygenase family protein [Caldilineaceae bacterium]
MRTEQSATAIQAQFAEQGYVVVEGVLDQARDLDPIFADYAALLDQLAARWYAEGKLPSTYAELPFGRRAAEIISQISDAESYHLDISLPKIAAYTEETPVHTSAAVFNLLTNPRLLDVIEQLIGPEIYSNPIQHARIKPPEAACKADAPGNGYLQATPWHQDQGVITTDADATDIISVWIPITGATEENGCLCMIPGSHREGLAPHCFEIPQKFRNVGVTPVPMKAGSVLFFHRLTKHCSLPNLSDDIRFSFDLRYSPVGLPTGRDEFPGFVARSRQNPESVLTDPQQWTERWHDARSQLVARGALDFRSRWRGMAQPDCA